jgi:hypothetical protein
MNNKELLEYLLQLGSLATPEECIKRDKLIAEQIREASQSLKE